MKVVVTIGSDRPAPSVLVPALKLAVAALLVLAVTNRQDIRRYLRLRRM